MKVLSGLAGSTSVLVLGALTAVAGQPPVGAQAPDVAISHRDRVYAAEQFSNTISVTDPADNKLLGEIRLGDPSPANFSPLYRGQLLVHGMGFSPDHRTLAVGVDRIQFCRVHRHGDKRREARYLRGPLASRGVFLPPMARRFG